MIQPNSLIFGDCLDIMHDIPNESIDFICADLPFGTTNCSWDTVIPFDPMWNHYKRIIKPNGAIALFAQTPFDKVLGASNLPMLRYEWIWEKTQATGHFNAKKSPMKAHENVLIFYKKLPTYNPQKTEGHKPVNSYTKRKEVVNKTAVYGKVKEDVSGGGNTDRYPRSVLKYASDKQTNYLHDTQKPIALVEYFVRTYTNPGDLVLDNCCGSGTLGEACINTGRNYIMMDNNLNNFNVAQKRINDILYKDLL